MNKSYLFCLLMLELVVVFGYAKDYKGAEYRTREAYTYGRFEARYKPPRGEGFLASFFTYHEISSSKEWNEIDIEILGRYDHDVQMTSIGPGQKIRNSHQWVAFNTHQDFHIYAFEWTPDYIAWFIDGQEVYRQDQAHVADFKYDQKIMMNIWPPSWEPWAGKLDDRVLPVFAFYDWVSYAAYTPGAGNMGTDNNFTLVWKDDFEFWDQSRWEKATHTFGGNDCDFVPENVVFKDGYLILCLTKANPMGYVDLNPPAIQWARAFQNKVTVGFTEPVEPTSAQKAANYLINGTTITEAKLLPDDQTVELTVSPLQPENSYTLIALGIRDRSANRNLMTGQVVPITLSQPLSFPVKINVGGPAYRDYLPDQLWSPLVEYGHQDGYEESWPASIDILGSEQDTVYLTGLHEVVYYKVRVPNGHYRVTLMLAENQFTEPGRRLFDIHIEDSLVAKKIDLYDLAGLHAAWNITVDDIAIADELIDIHFTNLSTQYSSYSLLNGIVIEPVGTEIDDEEAFHSQQFRLYQNYPNPFNASTTICYDLPAAAWMTLTIYNLQGQQICQLIKGSQPAGRHQVTWHPTLPSGLYFYQVDGVMPGGHFMQRRKMILVR